MKPADIAAAITTALNQNVRVLIALWIAYVVGSGFLSGKIAVEAFMTLAGGVVGYYFGVSRDNKRATDEPNGPAQPGSATATATVTTTPGAKIKKKPHA